MGDKSEKNKKKGRKQKNVKVAKEVKRKHDQQDKAAMPELATKRP